MKLLAVCVHLTCYYILTVMWNKMLYRRVTASRCLHPRCHTLNVSTPVSRPSISPPSVSRPSMWPLLALVDLTQNQRVSMVVNDGEIHCTLYFRVVLCTTCMCFVFTVEEKRKTFVKKNLVCGSEEYVV